MLLRRIFVAAAAVCVCSPTAVLGQTDDTEDEKIDLSFLTASVSDAQAASALDAALNGGGGVLDRDAVREAVELSMSRGWWDTSDKLLAAASRESIDASAVVHSTASRIRGRLQSLVDSLSASPKRSGIAPAFQWAQSPHAIFVEVKFAHKLDAPSTLGCDAEFVRFSPRGVDLRAECREKNKAFALSLTTLQALDDANCTWSMSSVGRATLTLSKATPGVWPRLLAGGRKPANMHTWWAMRDKFDADNDAFERAARAGNASATAAPASASANATAAAAASASVNVNVSAAGDVDAAPAATTTVAAAGGADANATDDELSYS